MKKKLRYIFLLLLLVLALSPSAVHAAWKTTNAGTIYTIKKSPGYATGFKKINGARYYFDPSSGVMATGFKKIQVKNKVYTYYFGTNGKRVSGMVPVEGVYYYFNKAGQMQYGFIQFNGKTFYADPSTGMILKNVWVDGGYYLQSDYTLAVNTVIDGKQVGADGRYTGPARNIGFVRTGSKTYYYNRRGVAVLGWLTVSGATYYLTPAVSTGFFNVGNYTYYARPDGEVVKNAWKDKKYLSSSGAVTKGWATIGTSRYYFSDSGDYVTGQQKIEEKVYLFDDKGALKTNFWLKTAKGKKCYFGGDGARVTGLYKINNRYYYFNKNGVMKKGFIKAEDGSLYYAHEKRGYLQHKGWFTANGYKYYARTDCSLVTGLLKLDGKLYGFSTDKGRMYSKCWQSIDGAKYYFLKNGAAIAGRWKKIGGKRYYFYDDGKLAVSTVVDGYTVDASGVRSGTLQGDGWSTISGEKHYVVNGKSVTGWQTISGSRYYFDSSGAMVTGIVDIKGKKYYFYPTGILAVNITIAVSSKEYTINSNGVVTAEKVISASGNNKGSQIANFAIKYIGNKYVYGGTSLTGGADCSGFVMTVFAQYGIKLLRVANDQLHGPSSSYVSAGYKKAVVVSPGYLLPGDLVFYGYNDYASHVAIYIGDGKIVHASNSQPYPAGGIKISNYNYQTPIGYVRYWS